MRGGCARWQAVIVRWQDIALAVNVSRCCYCSAGKMARNDAALVMFVQTYTRISLLGVGASSEVPHRSVGAGGTTLSWMQSASSVARVAPFFVRWRPLSVQSCTEHSGHVVG